MNLRLNFVSPQAAVFDDVSLRCVSSEWCYDDRLLVG